MAKLTLADLFPDTGSNARFNDNFALIETAVENTLSRDGTSPNQMEAQLDMNSYRIVNLVTPVDDTEPVTKGYADSTYGGGATVAAVAAQVAAEAAQAAAEAALDSFDDIYLGAKTVEPTLDNDGDALQDGALYYNTTDNTLYVYDLGTTTWLSVVSTDYVLKAGDTMTGTLTVPDIICSGSVDGRDLSVDGAKLDGIESGATGDQTAADIRTLGFFDTTNDGSGSGLDADLLDGAQGSEYAKLADAETVTDLWSFTSGVNVTGNITVSSGSVFATPSTTQWGLAMQHSSQYSGIYQTAGGDAQLILKDNVGTTNTTIDGATGNITTNGTVDGIDIAALDSAVAKTADNETITGDWSFDASGGSGELNVTDTNLVINKDGGRLDFIRPSGGSLTKSKIRFYDDTTEVGSLEYDYTSDYFEFTGVTLLQVNGNTVWHAGNDGSGSGLDADTLDGLESTQFLRSDVGDSITGGNLTFNDNLNLIFGNGTDSHIFSNGTNTYWDIGTSSNLYIRDHTGSSIISFRDSDKQVSVAAVIDFGSTGAIDNAKTVTFVAEVAVGTGTTVNWTSGQHQAVTPSGSTTYSFTAPSGPCTLILKAADLSTNTPTWPATVKWPSGTEPTWTTGTDIITFYFDGTNYYATSVALGLA